MQCFLWNNPSQVPQYVWVPCLVRLPCLWQLLTLLVLDDPGSLGTARDSEGCSSAGLAGLALKIRDANLFSMLDVILPLLWPWANWCWTRRYLLALPFMSSPPLLSPLSCVEASLSMQGRTGEPCSPYLWVENSRKAFETHLLGIFVSSTQFIYLCHVIQCYWFSLFLTYIPDTPPPPGELAGDFSFLSHPSITLWLWAKHVYWLEYSGFMWCISQARPISPRTRKHWTQLYTAPLLLQLLQTLLKGV